MATDWPGAESIETPRLTLEPLRIEHADRVTQGAPPEEFALLQVHQASAQPPRPSVAAARNCGHQGGPGVVKLPGAALPTHPS